MLKYEELSEQVIKACIEVHNNLGPGLLESTYEHCLIQELINVKIPFKHQLPIPVEYKGKQLDCGYRIDLLVDDKIIVELKCVESVLPVHEAQILTYMKLAGISIGLLINFNVKYLKEGLKRFVL